MGNEINPGQDSQNLIAYEYCGPAGQEIIIKCAKALNWECLLELDIDSEMELCITGLHLLKISYS